MNLYHVIDNFRDLKDEALRLRADMSYFKVLQTVAFCDYVIQTVSEFDAKYGTIFNRFTYMTLDDNDSVLTLEDIATQEQRDGFLERWNNAVALFSMTFHSEDEIGVTYPKHYAASKKDISSFIGNNNWSSHLFTGEEIMFMGSRLHYGKEGENDVRDKINGAICKDYAQRLKINLMKQRISIYTICQSFMRLRILGSIRDGAFNKWVVDEYTSIFRSFVDNERISLITDDIYKRCLLAADIRKNGLNFMRITEDDRLYIASAMSYVFSHFNDVVQQRQNISTGI